MKSDKIKAPWITSIVDALDVRQEDSTKHPYTCRCGYSLIPKREGWYCEECTYTQDWAYSCDC